MKITIDLNKAKVQAAAAAAFAENRLQALHTPPGGQTSCQYRDAHNLPCAIGAALTDEEAATLVELGQNELTIRQVIVAEAVTIVTDDPNYLIRLQRAHDNALFSVETFTAALNS